MQFGGGLRDGAHLVSGAGKLVSLGCSCASSPAVVVAP